MSAADAAREVRQLRRDGLTGTAAYAAAIARLDWFSAPYSDPADACMSCWSLKCSECGFCHECADDELISECPGDACAEGSRSFGPRFTGPCEHADGAK